jgi:hypothetical protein
MHCHGKDLFTLNVTVAAATPQENIENPSSDSQALAGVHDITIDPLAKEIFQSLDLKKGEEIVIEFTNPDNRFYNGILNGQDTYTGEPIFYAEENINYNGWENCFHDRIALELVSCSNRAPLLFHFKAIREGSLTLDFYSGHGGVPSAL